MITILTLFVASMAGSVFVASQIGFQQYGALATIVFFVLLGLFHANERAHRREQKIAIESDRVAIDLLTQVALAVYFAATWPALPLIVGFGKLARGDTSPPRAAS